MTSDEWALEIISGGYSIEFCSIPKARFLFSPLSPRAGKQDIVLSAIRHLSQIAAVESVPMPERLQGDYSIFFTVPKKNGDF